MRAYYLLILLGLSAYAQQNLQVIDAPTRSVIVNSISNAVSAARGTPAAAGDGVQITTTNGTNTFAILPYQVVFQAYSVTNTLAFGTNVYYSITNVTGNVVLNVTGQQANKALPLVVYLKGNATNNPTLTFPSGWNWLAGQPTSMTSNTTMTISLESIGSTSNLVQAIYLQQ